MQTVTKCERKSNKRAPLPTKRYHVCAVDRRGNFHSSDALEMSDALDRLRRLQAFKACGYVRDVCVYSVTRGTRTVIR